MSISATRSPYGNDFQPIFSNVEAAKTLQPAIKKQAVGAIDYAIKTLMNDKKLLANDSNGKNTSKAINKEIQSLQSLKKEVLKAKLNTGDQALKLNMKVQSKIRHASLKAQDVNASHKNSLLTLKEMTSQFNITVSEAGRKLNLTVAKEFDNVPRDKLWLFDKETKKINGLLKKIGNLVVKDPTHTSLSQVEKRASNLAKLCKQKDAAILANLDRGRNYSRI
ncbi:MAG: hypothetical protein Q8K75_02890 [Chlamydiales bacterium]|nr:hypothetical protein [Chlamydiales bacterium]